MFFIRAVSLSEAHSSFPGGNSGRNSSLITFHVRRSTDGADRCVKGVRGLARASCSVPTCSVTLEWCLYLSELCVPVCLRYTCGADERVTRETVSRVSSRASCL